MYQEFVMQRTLQNWKYWIVSQHLKLFYLFKDLSDFEIFVKRKTVWTDF